MNDIAISVEGIETPAWLDKAEAFARKVLEVLELDGWDLSLVFCDEAFIHGLNRQYRDKDEATDVLSFEQGEEYRDEAGALRFLAGDIVVSLDGLARNAEDFGVSRDEELRRLIVHGVLHLSGLDHADNDPAQPMLRKQEETLLALPGLAIL